MRRLRRWSELGVLGAVVAWALLFAPLARAPAAAELEQAHICSAQTIPVADHGEVPSDHRHEADCCLIACCCVVAAAILPGSPAPVPRRELASLPVPATWRLPPTCGPPLAFSARAPPHAA